MPGVWAGPGLSGSELTPGHCTLHYGTTGRHIRLLSKKAYYNINRFGWCPSTGKRQRLIVPDYFTLHNGITGRHISSLSNWAILELLLGGGGVQGQREGSA